MAGLTAKNPPLKNKFPEDKAKKLEPYYPFFFWFFFIFSGFSLLSYDDGEYGIVNNLFGRLGYFFSYLCFLFFGRSAFQLPIFSLIFGFIYFQKKDANLRKLAVALGILILSGSVFCAVFEREISSLKHGGGSLGVLLSNFLEFLVGKSGKILVCLATYIYGLLLILKESPKEFDKKYWLEVFSKNKERIFRWIVPPPDPAQEVKRADTEIPLKEHDLPWIEIKKVPRDWKFATTNPFSSDTDYKVSTVTPVETEEGFKEKTKYYYNIVRQSKPFSKIFGTKEPTTPKPPQKSIEVDVEKKEEISEPPIELPEISQALKEKIYGKPLPTSETMEAEVISSTPNWDEQVLTTQTTNDDAEDQITAAELEGLFGYGEEEEEETNLEPPVLEQTTKPEETLSQAGDLEKKLFSEELFSSEKEKKQPLHYTTVPQVNFLRKSNYKISYKNLATNLEKKPNPMFKLEAEYTARKIEEIIKEYGYESKVTTWQKGPIITRYEVAPPSGVKLGRITSLSDELKLYLAVKSIRIVAPIPGKSTIGIEVPNKYRENVLLGDIVLETANQPPSGDLPITLGKDSISGEIVFIDLNKLPHLLIAGTTGSGKSVSLNSMISYLILTKSPEEVRFVMIDPKMVEMSLYESIPHLVMPVITDPRKATKALFWAVQEMEARYAMVSEIKCRDIKAYNEKVSNSLLSRMNYKKMPYIVIFIDELSDLMMVAGKELEDSITRLSQKARAVGIHLVMATQRPSVDVITGLIKANCPARLAFHVAQKNDSKIILDYSGADTLLGKGDSLYKSPTSPDLQRIQAPFISEDEIEKIVAEASSFARPEYVDITLDEDVYREETSVDEEAEFEEAWNIVRMERKASASYLQRRMRIGYNKAARLMELMEQRGYVGPQIGSKPREILK
jgi:S-DNA-T family DNA segregation ATPase FtsK/SpoIIIE